MTLAIFAGCSGITNSNSGPNCASVYSGPQVAQGAAASISATLTVLGTDTNAAPLSVGCGYTNQPCVSVTICQPGTATCTTINNLLLDTGSYGLRVFSGAMTPVFISGLTQVTSGPNNLGECVSYADGSSQWGPVKLADVYIGQAGGQKAANVPIQVIDSSFSSASSAGCRHLDSQSIGYNGILGVGLFAQDCGNNCVINSHNNVYFSCTGVTCSSAAAPLVNQVTNPVSMMLTNNNGVVVQLSNVTDTGSSGVTGYLILGIDTQANNASTGRGYYPASATTGEFNTTFQGVAYSTAFIDSGSNGLYFNQLPSTPLCCDGSGFFCPNNVLSFTATPSGFGGGTSSTVSFKVSNETFLANQSGAPTAFNDLAGSLGGYSGFDWGLPFFLGRTVYVGIQSKVSLLGTGPYWGF